MEPVFDLASVPRERLLALIARGRAAQRVLEARSSEQVATIAQQQALMAEQQERLTVQERLLAEQEAIIAALRQRLADLEKRLGSAGPQGMPGLKPVSGKAKTPPPKGPRRHRTRAFVRKRSVPTQQVVHAVASCPECHLPLVGGWVKRRREVIELPLPPVQVTEHQYWERQCPRCHKRFTPTVDLQGQVMGKQRLGVGVLSLITTLREHGRLPFDTIQWYLETFHDLKLSAGALVAAVHQAAHRGQAEATRIRDRIRGSPVVFGDETGWREDGHNGYAWTFSTPTERYFVRGGRNKEVVDTVLGDQFAGVLVSDFYAAYNHYAGEHQRCWGHLLRAIHELQNLHPTHAGLDRWAAQVQRIYQDARTFTASDPAQRYRARQRYEAQLLAVCTPYVDDLAAPQRVLCQRVRQFLCELFVFVSHPEVPSDNNAAERSLRHLVTARKISGGTRSPEGSATTMTLATLFGTWRTRNLNTFLACRNLLTSPQP